MLRIRWRMSILLSLVTPPMKNRWTNVLCSLLWWWSMLVLMYVHGLQAGDIDELLSPGYPVFFNYVNILPTKAPPSLKVCTRDQHVTYIVPTLVILSLQEGTSVSEASWQRKMVATSLNCSSTHTRYTHALSILIACEHTSTIETHVCRSSTCAQRR